MASEFKSLSPDGIIAQKENESLQERLHLLSKLIQQNGGCLSFDAFWKDSLYGPNGYYRRKAEIGTSAGSYNKSEVDFRTLADNPAFIRATKHFYKGFKKEHPEGKFIEFGGGTGSMKRGLSSLDPEENLSQEYISIDISEKLIERQSSWGGENIRSSALVWPFKQGAMLATVFANELLDAFPMKVIAPTDPNNLNRSIQELCLTLDADGKVTPTWVPVQPGARNYQKDDYWDELNELLEYWEDFKTSLSSLRYRPNKYVDLNDYELRIPYLCVNLNEKRFVRQLSKLAPGSKVILTDYGYTLNDFSPSSFILPTGAQLRVYPSQNFSSKESLASIPNYYLTRDITSDVNWDNVILNAKRYGLEVDFFSSQHQFALLSMEDEIMPQFETSLKTLMRRSSFKTLILSKK
ncbi:MAG: hypothetical protein OHK0017_05660 [Patescibacteria group bacterium]